MGILEDSNFNCYDSTNLNKKENRDNLVDCSTFIGYSYNDIVRYIFLIISIISLILNSLLIKDYIIKKKTIRNRKQSSMKKLFTVLPILDCITSIYWIISSSIFRDAQSISDNRIFCSTLSIFYFSVFNFEFIFINFILINFRKISLNPIEGILKPDKNIKKYLTISIIATLIIIGISIGIKVIGRSPMNTCFLNTEQSGAKGLIFLLPIISTILVIFQVIYDLKCREMFINDRQVREAYKENSMYILVFSLLHFPMFLLIIITSSKNNFILEHKNILNNFIYFSTLLTCSIPMIIGIIRNLKGFTKMNQIKKLKERLTQISMKKSLTENLTHEDQFDWLEKHAMEFFMRDILLSIAHCIYTSKAYGKNIYLNDLEKENEIYIKYNIGFDSFKLNDETIDSYLNVNVIEYAPKIFAYLRNLENINIEKMAKSFLPKYNKQGISESQGKSGSFFISTDDNQYMIKTLRVDEFDLIRKTFLNEYVNYLTRNPNSLLCRLYGMYNIISSSGDEILIIVMRNVIGDFKNNIVAKFDLKGSKTNRKSKFDIMTKSEVSVMKDLNFNQYEHGIMISRENIKLLRKLTKFDSVFLSQMELMDYSLFLVKLTLSKEQAIDLFGKEIKEKQEKEFNELMIENSMKPSFILNDNEKNLNIDLKNLNFKEEINPKKSIRDRGEIYRHTKYYKHYIFPSIIPGTAYILAIIDYFQYFNFYKYVESEIKTKFGKKKEKQLVSCVDPKTYSQRFIYYFQTLTDIKHMLKVGQKNDENNFKSSNILNNEKIEEKEENDSILMVKKDNNDDSQIELSDNE